MPYQSRLLTSLAVLTLFTTACASAPANDPLEPYNRAMHNFNMKFNIYIMNPVTKGYRAITNQYARDRISNAMFNIKEPVSAVNHLLQGKPVRSGKDIARFAINSTLGLAGTYDVAGQGWNLPKDKTGFDATMGAWGVPDGPYFVIPFVGPGTPRAAAGLVVDSFTNPLYLATIHDANVHDKIYYPYVAVNGISLYDANKALLDDLQRNSVDFYSTLKSAYEQNRNGKNTDDNMSYDFEMDDEED